ncbi:uncharacterized protein LOC120001360 isoform X2 [Tripterygium wilfordii]|uniref:uncharacterized protein LOC120001360 isoform X2 n=1 Tax=Tripterygium wilfordii TaxID=458696 RepID=UPI0018F83698|nr:uncharacterized protein LOC120001360 isoform X2 [Tripterygium wilfordii]
MKNRRASTASGVESDPISLISLQVFDMTGYVINDFRFTTRQQMGWDYWVEVNKQGNRCQAFKLRRVEADNVVIVTNMIGKGNGCCLGSYCWCGWPTVVVMSSTLHFVAKQRSLPAFRWRLVAYYEFGIRNGGEIITAFSFVACTFLMLLLTSVMFDQVCVLLAAALPPSFFFARKMRTWLWSRMMCLQNGMGCHCLLQKH